MAKQTGAITVPARIIVTAGAHELATGDFELPITVSGEARPAGDSGAVHVNADVPGIRASIARALRQAADDIETTARSSHHHQPVQHRDGKPPWCATCGLTAAYTEPTSHPGTTRDSE